MKMLKSHAGIKLAIACCCFVSHISAQETDDLKNVDLLKEFANDEPAAGASCNGDLGTSITWYKDAKDAAKLARQENKLVFMIQVSGNFAREEFT